MIEILNLKVLNKGALIATFTVKMHKMGGLLLRECSLFESGAKNWVTMPSRQYESEGKKKYFPYIAFEDRTLDEKFRDKIKDEVMKHLKQKQEVNNKEQENQFEEIGDLPF